MRKKILLFLLLLSGCAGYPDEYLDSLNLSERHLSPSEIIDLEQSGILLATDLMVYGDWIAVKESQSANYVSLINYRNGDHFVLLRRGRGPGELISPEAFHGEASRLMMGDSGSNTFISVDIPCSVQLREAVIDTLFQSKNNLPINLRPINDRFFLSSDMRFKDPFWYVLRDMEGSVLSSVSAPDYDVMKEMDLSHLLSFIASSLFTINPEKDKVCAVMNPAAALSFSACIGSALQEYKRYEYNPPVIAKKGSSTAFSGENFTNFGSAVSDERYVYLLYSGKQLRDPNSSVPSYEADHLIVYDWGGNARFHFRMDHPSCGMYLYNHQLFCISTYPQSTLYIYNLPLL